MQDWLILKSEKGPYLNSPKVFREVGLISDDSPENACVRACFLCGSSEIRLMPIYELAPEENEDG